MYVAAAAGNNYSAERWRTHVHTYTHMYICMRGVGNNYMYVDNAERLASSRPGARPYHWMEGPGNNLGVARAKSRTRV